MRRGFFVFIFWVDYEEISLSSLTITNYCTMSAVFALISSARLGMEDSMGSMSYYLYFFLAWLLGIVAVFRYA